MSHQALHPTSSSTRSRTIPQAPDLRHQDFQTMLSLTKFFSSSRMSVTAPLVPQDSQVILRRLDPLDEEREHLQALYDAAHDPTLLDVRRQMSSAIRASQLHSIEFIDPVHRACFSKFINSVSSDSILQLLPPADLKPIQTQALIKPVRVENFEIIKKIGAGASGTVYLAQNRKSRRLHAIKKMEKYLTGTDGIASLLNEQRCLWKVRGHDGLLGLDASFHDKGSFYLVTAFLPGGDLRTRMDQHGRLPIPVALFYTAETLLALRALHALGIVHRDVKPENILIDTYGHVVLGDFGIAKHWRATPSGTLNEALDPEFATPFVTHAQCGTPAYTAPEVFYGKPYAFEVDLWSLCVTTFEMICGRIPFNSTGDFKTISRSVRRDEVSFRLDDEVDIAVQLLLLHVLQKDPAQRLDLHGIMGHMAFRHIDWSKLAAREIDAPWVPGQFDLFEEIRDAKVHEQTFQFVSGGEYDDDPFPFYNFVAPDFSLSKSRNARTPSSSPVTPAFDLPLATPSSPALSIRSFTSSLLSPHLSGFFGRVRSLVTPQSSESAMSSVESLPVSPPSTPPLTVFDADPAIQSPPRAHGISALRSECRVWLKKNLKISKSRKNQC